MLITSLLIGAAVLFITPRHGAAADEKAVASPLDEVGLYAAYEEVSRPEAAYELAAQDVVGDAEPAYAEALGATFGGLVIEHKPAFRVRVFGTEAAGADLVSGVSRDWGLLDVVEFTVVQRSLTTLQADAEKIAHALGRSAEVGTDIGDNVVTVGVLALDELTVAVPAYVRVNVVGGLPAPAVNMYGGATLSGGCTSGFNINKGGGNGLTTAGHCGNTESWGGQNLPFQAEAYSGSNDEQWHTPGPNPVPNRIWINHNGDWITITSRTFKANQATGTWVCKYGNITGDGCGVLDDKNYCANYVPNFNCTYHKLSNDGVDLSTEGDSGGPVYKNQSAWGIISGSSYNIHTLCYCNLLYTPINYVESGLGAVVKTAP